MASTGRNMSLPIIITKYTFCDTVVFDYIPFPRFIHNGEDTLLRFLDSFKQNLVHETYTSKSVSQKTYRLIGYLTVLNKLK